MELVIDMISGCLVRDPPGSQPVAAWQDCVSNFARFASASKALAQTPQVVSKFLAQCDALTHDSFMDAECLVVIWPTRESLLLPLQHVQCTAYDFLVTYVELQCLEQA